MRIKPFIKRILTSPQRSLTKHSVLASVLKTEQLNTDVVNIHRMDPQNVGDYYCAPHHYFSFLNQKALDIFDYKSSDKTITNNWIRTVSEGKLIIGGGGLLNRGSFEKQMRLFETLGKKNKKSVLWGIGHNSKDKKDFGKITSYSIDTGSFGLVGTRDYDISEKDWVPCVSCLHPVFDKIYPSTQEIGVVFHKKTLKNRNITSKFSQYPTTSNTVDLEKLINFIGSSETIITDSYHAMYWAFLLEKKVVVIPNSSKFFSFKYKPVFSTFEDSIKDVKKGKNHTGILKECRELNNRFAEKVFDYLEL